MFFSFCFSNNSAPEVPEFSSVDEFPSLPASQPLTPINTPLPLIPWEDLVAEQISVTEFTQGPIIDPYSGAPLLQSERPLEGPTNPEQMDTVELRISAPSSPVFSPVAELNMPASSPSIQMAPKPKDPVPSTVPSIPNNCHEQKLFKPPPVSSKESSNSTAPTLKILEPSVSSTDGSEVLTAVVHPHLPSASSALKIPIEVGSVVYSKTDNEVFVVVRILGDGLIRVQDPQFKNRRPVRPQEVLVPFNLPPSLDSHQCSQLRRRTSQLHVSRDNLAYELRDTKRKCEQAYRESSSLRRSLDNCRADLLNTERECFSLKDKLKNSQKELQRTTDTLKQTQDELQKSSSASSNNNDLVAEVSRLSALSERYKAERNSSRGDCEVLTTKIKRLERLEESSHHECSQLCRHMQRISVSLDKLRHSLKNEQKKPPKRRKQHVSSSSSSSSSAASS